MDKELLLKTAAHLDEQSAYFMKRALAWAQGNTPNRQDYERHRRLLTLANALRAVSRWVVTDKEL